eukprot:4634372-Amphidinium_carterae.3
MTWSMRQQLFADENGTWPSVTCSERANGITMKLMSKRLELIPILENYGMSHVVQGAAAAASSMGYPATPVTTPEQIRGAVSPVGSPIRQLALPPC